MLIISVSLVLALVTQIFKPLQTFLQSYMGDYIGCLLEVGELPSLGTDQTTPGAEECNAKFDKASFSEGRPPINTPGGGSNATNPPPPPTSNSSSSESGSSGGQSGGTYAGSSSRGGGRSFNPPGRGPSGIDGTDSRDKGKTIEIALEGGGSGGFFAGRNGATYARPAGKTKAIGLTGLTDEDKKKLEKKEIAGRQTIAAGEGFASASKKTIVKPPEAKAEVGEEEKAFTIGNFIRYLFIAAIIIALVIFIGGQALQMSKSFEK
ncbi:hypothetical protein D3C87_87830 [compost metagenome]